ncbi:MAG TPA: DNA topoisomerase IB [Bauldia sp.]|nr:DNA topoisomerase IB [Bauldia sp.]
MAFTEIQANGAADAKAVGLIYVSDERPGISRVEINGAFRYRDHSGRAVRDAPTLKRIRRLAVPPAWTDVWISPSPNGHIQATGRDARGRKQYRYHPDFRAVRDGNKYEHLIEFATALPKLRRRIERDMRRPGLPREKVLATIVHLLERTFIRVGNAEYARQNNSFGLTTMRNRHVIVGQGTLRFEFKGKSNKVWRLKIEDRRVAKIVKSCQELPGQHLFQYLDETGERQRVGSADVNQYLREVTGRDVTAKDFRTWAGTVLAATRLLGYPPADTAAVAKANLREAIEEVADRLGNTPTVCRKCYVHPAVIESYLAGNLALDAEARAGKGFRKEERAVLAFLKRRLRKGRRGAVRVRAATAAAAAA